MATFDSRRKLTREDIARVVGAGVGAGVGTGVVVGLLTAYVVRLLVQRERLSGGRDAAGSLEIRVERGGG
jgi:hypothetical protein